MSKSEIINFFGDLAIQEDFKSMTKKDILKLINDEKIGYGLSIAENVDKWNKGGLTKKKYCNPVKIVDNRKKKK